MNKANTQQDLTVQPKERAQDGRRGFIFGLTAGASVAGAAVIAGPAKASTLGVASSAQTATAVGTGLSEHARKYYRSTTI